MLYIREKVGRYNIIVSKLFVIFMALIHAICILFDDIYKCPSELEVRLGKSISFLVNKFASLRFALVIF